MPEKSYLVVVRYGIDDVPVLHTTSYYKAVERALTIDPDQVGAENAWGRHVSGFCVVAIMVLLDGEPQDWLHVKREDMTLAHAWLAAARMIGPNCGYICSAIGRIDAPNNTRHRMEERVQTDLQQTGLAFLFPAPAKNHIEDRREWCLDRAVEA